MRRFKWGELMFGSGNGYSFLLVPMIMGAVMTGLRFWMFYAGSSAIRSARMSRINDSDAHLSFDERIAERMRELEREKHEAPSAPSPSAQPSPSQAAPSLQPSAPTAGPTGATGGFGRRQA